MTVDQAAEQLRRISSAGLGDRQIKSWSEIDDSHQSIDYIRYVEAEDFVEVL